jgi:hypothetical protein
MCATRWPQRAPRRWGPCAGFARRSRSFRMGCSLCKDFDCLGYSEANRFPSTVLPGAGFRPYSKGITTSLRSWSQLIAIPNMPSGPWHRVDIAFKALSSEPSQVRLSIRLPISIVPDNLTLFPNSKGPRPRILSPQAVGLPSASGDYRQVFRKIAGPQHRDSAFREYIRHVRSGR